MNIGCKLQKLRKEKGYSQEELADKLGVSRQSVSKWESDLAYPETEKLIKLSELYGITIDSLLKEECYEKKENVCNNFYYRRPHYEYKSKRTLFGLPLVHVNVGSGLYVAKGIIAIGNIARGFVSIGLVSVGIISIGLFTLGLLSIGVFAIGLIMALGSIALGTIAFGAIAIGLFSFGAISIGYFSYGALSIAKYVAIGDNARGLIAIGYTKVSGTYTFSNSVNKQEISQLIDDNVPKYWSIFINWIKALL